MFSRYFSRYKICVVHINQILAKVHNKFGNYIFQNLSAAAKISKLLQKRVLVTKLRNVDWYGSFVNVKVVSVGLILPHEEPLKHRRPSGLPHLVKSSFPHDNLFSRILYFNDSEIYFHFQCCPQLDRPVVQPLAPSTSFVFSIMWSRRTKQFQWSEVQNTLDRVD